MPGGQNRELFMERERMGLYLKNGLKLQYLASNCLKIETKTTLIKFLWNSLQAGIEEGRRPINRPTRQARESSHFGSGNEVGSENNWLRSNFQVAEIDSF